MTSPPLSTQKSPANAFLARRPRRRKRGEGLIAAVHLLSWAASLPATPERDELTAALTAHLNGVPLEAALGWKRRRGQRSPETKAATENRDAAIRDAASALFPADCSLSRRADDLAKMLRRGGSCPPAGISPAAARQHVASIIASNSRRPAARTIRRVLAMNSAAFRGQNSPSSSNRIEDDHE